MKSTLGCDGKCGSCSRCRSKSRMELFTSPLHSKSNLGKWTPMMTKETFYNKMVYRPHNKFNELIRDKDAIIHMLLKRQAMTSPHDSRYAMISQQLEQLQNQVSELKQQKMKMLEDRNALLRYATEHAGNVVPVDAVYHAMTGRIPKMKMEDDVLRPVGSPEDTYEDEDGGEKVGGYSTGPLGNGADIEQEQEEGSDESSPLEIEEVPKPPIEITPIKEESDSDAESVRGIRPGRQSPSSEMEEENTEPVPQHPPGSTTDEENLQEIYESLARLKASPPLQAIPAKMSPRYGKNVISQEQRDRRNARRRELYALRKKQIGNE